MLNECYIGDVRDGLRAMIAAGVRSQTCVTSPPYWGLRDYGTASWEGGEAGCDHRSPTMREGRNEDRAKLAGSEATNKDQLLLAARTGCGKCGATRIDKQLGLEPTIAEYVANMVEVFRLVRDVLADDGTLWLNLGDSYCSTAPGTRGDALNQRGILAAVSDRRAEASRKMRPETPDGLKPKDICGIPWAVATALRAPYYAGRIKSESDRAWLAGFLDGEGTISFVERDRGEDRTPTHDCRVFITNCDDVPLRHFAAMTAGHVYQHDGERENRFGSRPCFRWQMGTHDAALLLRELFPYLRTKRKQASLIWTLFTTLRHQNGHASTPLDVLQQRRAIAELVRALNRGESVELPSWVIDPPPATEPGWFLRQDIIWKKPNPMPESVTDRCTKSHEYLFLLSKRERYYFDAAAIAEPAIYSGIVGMDGSGFKDPQSFNGKHATAGMFGARTAVDGPDSGMRNKRSVWTVTTQPYSDAHFATFPPKLIEPCIMAGSRVGDVVLDPFMGSGTVAMVAQSFGRKWLGCELSRNYAKLIKERTRQQGMEFPA
jgi:DNA modification methylase